MHLIQRRQILKVQSYKPQRNEVVTIFVVINSYVCF